MTKLTLQHLIDLDACKTQRDLFESLFGQAVDIDPKLCAEHADRFNWLWAAKHLLTPTLLAEFTKVTDELGIEIKYVRAIAWEEYQNIEITAWNRYLGNATSKANLKYCCIVEDASKRYDESIAGAIKAITQLEAVTFGRLYCEQEREAYEIK